MILAMKHKFFLNILYWDIHVLVHAQSEGPFCCQVNEIEKIIRVIYYSWHSWVSINYICASLLNAR